MSEFWISSSDTVSDEELLFLYSSVGRTAYTRDPDVLTRAIRGSSFVVSARGPQRELWDLARAISDDVTICYLQDILVRPDARRAGVGRALLEHVQQTQWAAEDPRIESVSMRPIRLGLSLR
ncbi:MAG: GNAT family N-acetyltransferase [Cryobacterium sp.]|uniref:GNAT family N-acetyltransferase n=1 Tax=Cryobacterium sp. TaxID=1926290 RepID=UPI0022A099D3|nr:GNAT family N-acetyltransferase [Cryobacterium sp.]MCY7405530.1 GNAT family N-acetyltransferase [Cryobacterium sp.]